VILTGWIELNEPTVLGFAGESQLSQKKMLHMALKTPMTINELYRTFPHISEQNIAPLVAQLVQEKKAWVIDRKKVQVSCGVERMQNVYSSREEDRPKDMTETINLLESSFGILRPIAPAIAGRVHIMKDD
jgi:hypothetical protein